MEGGSEFILTILGAMAQQESANMSKRVKFGKDITAQKGRVPNLVFGYDKIPDERYTLKINEEEAKIVKEIFESYVYKGWGTTKIAWDLNDRGIRTKKTKSKWVQTSIVRMLKNPIYTGRVTNKKSEVTDFITGTRKDLPEEEWIVVERPEMRIISDELFNRAQEILEQRSNEFKLKSKREKTEYVFSTLIYCKHCGYSFRRIKRKYTEDGNEYILNSELMRPLSRGIRRMTYRFLEGRTGNNFIDAIYKGWNNLLIPLLAILLAMSMLLTACDSQGVQGPQPGWQHRQPGCQWYCDRIQHAQV